jgi:hypothetical protein
VNQRELTNTKLTFSVHVGLLDAFNDALKTCHLQRDGFLEHVIESEIPHVISDLEGKTVSKGARLYIDGELRAMPRKPVSVVFKKTTANKLKDVVKKHGLVRDALINRILLLLVFPKQVSAVLEIGTHLTSDVVSEEPAQPIGLLGGIRARMDDPLGYIRASLALNGQDRLHTALLHPNLMGFSCYLSNEWVPDTAEKHKSDREFRQLLNSLTRKSRAKRNVRSNS